MSGECQLGQGQGTVQRGGAAAQSPVLTVPCVPYPSAVKKEAQSLIKQFFHNRARCESEADWHGLCGPQR